MKFMHKIITTIFVSLIVFPLIVNAQNNTSSPYSKFGAGDLSNVGYGRNLALGGTGFALRDKSYINLKNPASLTAIDTLSALFEMGVFGQFTQNSTNELSNYYKDGNITHLAFAHRYTSWLMGSYGIMPFSDIGYQFRTFKSVEGETSIVYTDWVGSGGINRLFYGLGLKVTKNFSLGGDIAYYYGPMAESRKINVAAEPNSPTYYYTNTRYSGITYKAAAQFSANLGDKGTSLILGGVFSPAQTFSGKTLTRIEQSYNSSSVITIDVAESRSEPFTMPQTYGAGLGFTWQGKYMLTADYENAAWSNGNPREYIDQSIYSFGLERVPQNDLKYFERCAYRVGFRYDSGYHTAKGKAIDDMRFSMGVGFPMQKSRSMLNVSMELGQKGTTSLGLIRERYAKLTVAFSFHDYWFVKRKID